jgi:hypothetical protein
MKRKPVVVIGVGRGERGGDGGRIAGLSRPEVGLFLRSECRRRKTKDAHDEDHAQLHP